MMTGRNTYFSIIKNVGDGVRGGLELETVDENESSCFLFLLLLLPLTAIELPFF
jgi:hypothetical protein